MNLITADLPPPLMRCAVCKMSCRSHIGMLTTGASPHNKNQRAAYLCDQNETAYVFSILHHLTMITEQYRLLTKQKWILKRDSALKQLFVCFFYAYRYSLLLLLPLYIYTCTTYHRIQHTLHSLQMFVPFCNIFVTTTFCRKRADGWLAERITKQKAQNLYYFSSKQTFELNVWTISTNKSLQVRPSKEYQKAMENFRFRLFFLNQV